MAAAKENAPIQGCVGSKDFEGSPLSIEWRCLDEGRAVTGRLWLRPSGPEQVYFLDRKNPTCTLALGTGSTVPQGQISLLLGEVRAGLRGDIQLNPRLIYEDLIAEWPVSTKPLPGVEGSKNAGVVIEEIGVLREIFPFVVTSPPGPVSPSLYKRRFVACLNAAKLPLYKTLAPLRREVGGLSAMQEAAEQFYASNDFVPSLESLGAPFTAFAALWQELFALTGEQSFENLNTIVEGALGTNPGTFLVEQSTSYDDLWQSIFALALIAELIPELSPPKAHLEPDTLILGVRIFAFLQALVADRPSLLEEEGRREQLSVIPLVPDAVTPPPATLTTVKNEPTTGWASLLGVGLLSNIEQRFHGYRLGEIAFTLNLMPGESRVLSRRDLSKNLDTSVEEESAKQDETSARESEGLFDLKNELADLLASKSICRNYDDTKTYQADGLSFTFSGTKKGCECPSSRAAHLASDFAQRLTQIAQNRIDKRSSQKRQAQLIEEREQKSRVELDNKAGESRRVGVYRWLQALYEMSLVPRGKRLIVELLVPSPATHYLSSLEADDGPPIHKPEAPAIKAPTDITADNYLTLAATYDAKVAPPPQQTRVFVATIERPGASEPRLIELAEGYQATSASITVLLSDQSYPLMGFLADYAFSVPAVPSDQEAPANDSQDACPPCPDPFAQKTPPTPNQHTFSSALPATTGDSLGRRLPLSVVCDAPGFALSFTVSASLTDYQELYARWQIETYDAIVAAYERKLVDFRGALRTRVARTSRDRRRSIEARSLEDVSLPVLWSLHTAENADEPFYLRLFERAFVWDEIAYHFYPFPPGAPRPEGARWPGQALVDPESDALFASFLDAQSARVLAPVTPGYELVILFYFRYGTRSPWSLPNIPLAEGYLAAMGERLLQDEAEPDKHERWRIEIPTEHIVLQDGADLPTFKG